MYAAVLANNGEIQSEPSGQKPERAAAKRSQNWSFYPNAGTVSNSESAAVADTPWTRRGRPFSTDDSSVRLSSRERRHRSSWHAALNKRLVNMQDAEEMLVLVDEMLPGFDMLNTVTALNRFSRLLGASRRSRDPRALEILYRIEAWLATAGAFCVDADGPEAIQPRHLASIATSLARLGWKESTAGRVLRGLAAIAPPLLPGSRPRDLSNLAWAWAALELRGFDALLLAIAREAVIQIDDFNEQNLSNTCWAFAKLGLRHDPLIKAIAEETVKKLSQFSAQGLTNTLWGFATLVIKGEECLGQYAWQLICALLEEIQRRMPDCTTQELSNSSWACCRLGVRHEGFMKAVCERGFQILTSYTPQDLSNTAMAFAKPNLEARAFLEAMSREAAKKMHLFEAREISNLTWSLTIFRPSIVGPEWIDETLGHFEALQEGCEGWELVQLVNACWAHRRSLRRWAKLQETFLRRVYQPVLRVLKAVVGREGCSVDVQESADIRGFTTLLPRRGPGPPPPLAPLEAARREAQRLITELQVDFLGPIYTRAAMEDLGFVDPSDPRMHQCDQNPHVSEPPPWGMEARKATYEALEDLKSKLPFMWFDRFGPHERRVLSWVSFRVQVEIARPSTGNWLKEELAADGFIAGYSLDERRALNQQGQETLARLEASAATARQSLHFTLQDIRQAQQWLQGLFAQHDRTGHAERQGLLEVALEVVGAIRRLRLQLNGDAQRVDVEESIRQGLFDGSLGAAARGEVRLFVCHFCCISCLAALSNFARRFPLITLHVDFDDCWKTRALDV